MCRRRDEYSVTVALLSFLCAKWLSETNIVETEVHLAVYRAIAIAGGLFSVLPVRITNNSKTTASIDK